jgi:CHAT domain-containing protein
MSGEQGSGPTNYSPSAAVLKYCLGRRQTSKNTCLCIGSEFKDEAQAVADIFKVSALLQDEEVKDRLILGLENKDIIHFSCHGIFDQEDPLCSRIKLNEEEILTAKEVFNLKLDAGLVTLSACETGINKVRPGDELIGLTRAFLCAGTSSVVVSLWLVYAPASLELMKKFYKSLKGGLSKPNALQNAQIDLIKSNKYSHPYYWAPFILVGDYV